MSKVALSFLACAALIIAQEYTISTFAGGVPANQPAPGTNIAIGSPSGVALDRNGNLYISGGLNSAFRLDKEGLLRRIAGGVLGFSGDGGPAISAALSTDVGEAGWPSGVAVDQDGNVYVADTYNHRVRRISLDGRITTVVGNGDEGLAGDGGPATAARLSFPSGLAVDSAGSLYIAIPSKGVVRKVAPNGTITTVAGRGTQGLSGDGGLATEAELRNPVSIAVSTTGDLYIVDAGYSGIRRVSPDGLIRTVPGSVPEGFTGDLTLDSRLEFAIAGTLDRRGNIVFATSQGRVRRLSSDGTVVTIAGIGGFGFEGDGGPAAQARFSGISSMAVDDEERIFVADVWNKRVRRISREGTIMTVAGNGTERFGGDGGPVTSAQFYTECCASLASDPEGALYVADTGSARVRKVSVSGVITTIAGNGNPGYSGDGEPATSAQLMQPRAVAVARSGDVFIADGFNYRVRKVSREGNITTVAGNGTPGQSGDGGPAIDASLGHVFGIALDGSGNLYLAELALVGIGSGFSNRIRKVSPDGTITTLVNSHPLAPASEQFMPLGIAADQAANVYFTDHGKHRVLHAFPDGRVRVFAGNGNHGAAGEGGPAAEAELDTPISVATDENGNVYIGEAWSPRLLRVSPEGILTRLAGTRVSGHSGDGGPATEARISPVSGIASGPGGEIYISGYLQTVIRVLRPIAAGQ